VLEMLKLSQEAVQEIKKAKLALPKKGMTGLTSEEH
jgi:hypothetical protein